jgi:hypothetical protein
MSRDRCERCPELRPSTAPGALHSFMGTAPPVLPSRRRLQPPDPRCALRALRPRADSPSARAHRPGASRTHCIRREPGVVGDPRGFMARKFRIGTRSRYSVDPPGDHARSIRCQRTTGRKATQSFRGDRRLNEVRQRPPRPERTPRSLHQLGRCCRINATPEEKIIQLPTTLLLPMPPCSAEQHRLAEAEHRYRLGDRS